MPIFGGAGGLTTSSRSVMLMPTRPCVPCPPAPHFFSPNNRYALAIEVNDDPWFSDGAYWNIGAGYTVGDTGRLKASGGIGYVYRGGSGEVVPGTYNYTITIENYVSGAIRIYMGATPTFTSDFTANGTYTGQIANVHFNEFGVNSAAGFTGEISYFQLQPVGPTAYNVDVLTATTPAPSLSLQTGKILKTVTTPAPSLVKQIGKNVRTTSTPVPSLQRSTAKSLLTTSTPVPTVAKSTAKSLKTTSTPVPSLIRSTVKILRTTSTPVPTLAKAKTTVKTIQGQSTPAPSLQRSIGKVLQTTSTPVPSLTRAVSKSLLTATTPAPSLLKTIAKTLRVTTVPVPTLAKTKVAYVTIQAVTGGIASGGLSGPRVTMMFFRG